MGVDLETARFLLARRDEGACFDRCATLGRQHYFLSATESRRLLREFGRSPAQFPDLFAPHYPAFADAFWRMLGARTLHSIDASGFEGATHVHDLNQPIPEAWRAAYDVVCDCGTLEHVFDFPAALRNCLEMIAPGGHFFAQTPANNYFGHGFYQFSPELFFRVFSPANGFRIERCVAVEYGLRRRWFEVADPAVLRNRVTLINAVPVVLLVWARRDSIQPLFAQPPQQSDYAAAWTGHTGCKDDLSSPADGPGDRTLPGVAQRDPGVAAPEATPLHQTGTQGWMDRGKHFLLAHAPRLARALDALRISRFNRRFSFRNPSFTPIGKTPSRKSKTKIKNQK